MVDVDMGTSSNGYSMRCSLPSNVPRLLLREYYREYRGSEYVLCTMRETLNAVRSGELNWLSHDAVLNTIRSLLFWKEGDRSSSNGGDGDGFPELRSIYGIPAWVVGHAYDSSAARARTPGSTDGDYPLDNYHMVKALLYRLCVSHEWMNSCSDFDPSRMGSEGGEGGEGENIILYSEVSKRKYRLQLFVDTHLDLCEYMRRTGTYEDDELSHPEKNNDDISISAFDMYEPRDEVVMYGGGLPDLTPCLDIGNVWFIFKSPRREDTITSALIHIIASKTQSHKCQPRNFERILQGYMRDYPQMLLLFRMIVEVSLLGNYSHARYRPSFERRLDIRETFRSKKMTDNVFFLWMTENDELIKSVTKEYYSYMIDLHYGLGEIIKQTKYWEEFRKSIIKSMDTCRHHLDLKTIFFDLFPPVFDGGKNKRGEEEEKEEEKKEVRAEEEMGNTKSADEWVRVRERDVHVHDYKRIFKLIQKELEYIHDTEMLPYISKLKKGSFVDYVEKLMGEYHQKELTDKHSSLPQTSETALFDLLGLDEEALVEKVREITLVVFSLHRPTGDEVEGGIRRCVPPTHMPDPGVEFKWLKCFGISEMGFHLIRQLYYEYERKEISDNSIPKRIAQIYANREKDFHLIRIYFKMIKKVESLSQFSLSSDYLENQLGALRAKCFLLPWENLPEDADLFYYCPNCDQWLNPVIESIPVGTGPGTGTRTRTSAGTGSGGRSSSARGSSSSTAGFDNVYAHGFEMVLYDVGKEMNYCGKQNIPINIKKCIESGVYYGTESIESEKVAKNIRKNKEKPRCCNTPLVGIHMLGKCKKLGKRFWAMCEICAGLTEWEGAKFGPNGFTCCQHYKYARFRVRGNENEDEDEDEEKEKDERENTEIRPRMEGYKCFYCEERLVEAEEINRIIRILRTDDVGYSYRYENARLCKPDYEKCKWMLEKNGNKIQNSDEIKKVVSYARKRDQIKTKIQRPKKIF